MKRQHYFSLAFADDGGRALSVTMKGRHRQVTAVMIREAMQALDMSENSALLSVCWLGKMTEQEYVSGKAVGRWLRHWWVALAIGFPAIIIPALCRVVGFL